MLMLVACGDRVLLGSLRDAASDSSPLDEAESDSDATSVDRARADGSLPDVGPPALSARLATALGALPDLTGCERSCLDVAVSIDGGAPPYQVVWPDGIRASSRSLCLDQDGGSAFAEVVDSLGTRTVARFEALTVLSPCDSLAPYWKLCSLPLAPLARTCGAEDAPPYAYDFSPYARSAGLGFAQLSLRSGIGLLPSAEVFLGTSPCEPELLATEVSPWPLPPQTVTAPIEREDGLPGALLMVRFSPPVLSQVVLEVRYCEARDAAPLIE